MRKIAEHPGVDYATVSRRLKLEQQSELYETIMKLDHAQNTEHLGVSDSYVIQVRRFLLKAVNDLEAGKQPPGVVIIPAKLTFLASAATLLTASLGRCFSSLQFDAFSILNANIKS
jgi:hypothetical protein